MVDPSSSQAPSPASDAGATRKRSRSSFSHADIDKVFADAEGALRRGKAEYWKYVFTVKDEDSVKYQCKLCSTLLSVRNPHDSVKNHIQLAKGQEVTCKKKASLEGGLKESRDEAIGAIFG